MFKRNNLGSNGQRRFGMFFIAFAVMLTCLTAHRLLAQSDTGNITGTVTDSTGAVIQGAAVTATNTDDGQKLTAVSNGTGGFTILAVPRGTSVVIAAKGFQSESSAVTITVATTQTLEFKLNPAGASASIEVTATAPLVDSSDGTIGATIQGEQVTELPLNGRNFTNLALLTPGVTRGAYGDNASGGGSSNNTETMRYNESGDAALSINGLRPQANNYLLDGVDNNDGLVNTILFFPAVDAIQEFKVNTSVAPAEYGAQAGQLSLLRSSPARISFTVRHLSFTAAATSTPIRTISSTALPLPRRRLSSATSPASQRAGLSRRTNFSFSATTRRCARTFQFRRIT